MDLQLRGRAAIVTGASRGLGKAIALSLAAEGVNVIAAARTASALQAPPQEGQGLITGVECDLREPEQLDRLVPMTLDRYGRLDILVNNAGLAPAIDFLEQDWALWEELFAVNVTAPARLAQAAGRHFRAHAGGKIINVASTAGVLGKASLVAYSAAKGALIQLTRSLAAEWARHGIQVNAIAPGAFQTDAQRRVLEDEQLLARRLRKIPARRMAASSEIGPLACYLSSPLSDFVTGAIYVIDGGETAKQ